VNFEGHFTTVVALCAQLADARSVNVNDCYVSCRPTSRFWNWTICRNLV